MRIITRIVAATLVLLSLGGCASWKEMQARELFDRSSREYNRMVRWEEAEAAGLTFADKKIRDQFLARVEAAKEVKIADFRVKSVEYDSVRSEAKVKVEYDYYIPPSPVVRTLVDTQVWSYEDENEVKNWRLLSLYPEFK